MDTLLVDQVGLDRLLGHTAESIWKPVAIIFEPGVTRGRAAYVDVVSKTPRSEPSTHRVEGALLDTNRELFLRLAAELGS